MSAQPMHQDDNPVHEVRHGKQCHYFQKKTRPGSSKPVWVCDCGECRDALGRTL